MDDSEKVPPARLSMTDAELEAAVELAKSQPNGLINAIALLEEQTRLRAEDDARLAAFNQEHSSTPEPVVHPPVEAPKLSEFDAVLEGATDSETDSAFTTTDFSVTGVLQQIVDQVNVTHAQPELDAEPHEAEVEDQIHAPVAAFAEPTHARTVSLESATETEAPNLARASRFSSVWNLTDSLIPVSITVTLAVLLTLSERPEYQITGSHFFGLLIGIVLSATFGLLLRKGVRLAGGYSSLLARQTFGVWGAIVPAVGALVFLVSAFAPFELALTAVTWRALNGLSPQVFGFYQPDFPIYLVLLVIGFAFALLVKKFVWFGRVLTLVGSIGLVLVAVLGFTTESFSSDFFVSGSMSVSIQVALGYLLLSLAFGLVHTNRSTEAQSSPLEYLLANLAFPALFASLLALALQASSDWWMLSAGLLIVLALAASGSLINRIGQKLQTLAVMPGWLVSIFALCLAGLATYLIHLYLISVPQLLLWLAVPAAAHIFAVAADQVARSARVHELSLVRGYGFYGRASVLNLAGYTVSVLLGLALSSGFVWSEQVAELIWLPFGEFTGAFTSGLVSMLWMLTLGRLRVARQEAEVLKVERRKSELAGIDEIVGLP